MRFIAFIGLVLAFVLQSHAQYCTTATSTTAITPSSTVQNTATFPAGTAPVFTFTGNAGCTYTFTTCGLSSVDTYLRIYNSAVSLIQGWDDQCGLQTNAVWTCPATGAYSIQLSQYVCGPLLGAATMAYSMSCPTPPCTNPVVNAGNDVVICAGASGQLSGTVTAGTGSTGGSGGTMVVTISGPTWLDMVSWTLTNASGAQIGSGGPYASGSTNTITIATPGAGPYSFYLETLGTICDNTANYTITCNGSIVSSGSVGPCLSTTVSVASCTGGPSTTPITYVWTPSTALSATNILDPIASPSTTTTYTLTATQGTCTGQDQVTVYVNPLPTVNAGPDVSLCGGQASTTLTGTASATGGFTGDITVNIFSGSNLDETTWTMTNSLGAVIASGGPYAAGSNNTVTISSPTNAPFTFNLETQGAANSNVAGYNILCGGINGTSVSGGIAILTGGMTAAIPIAGCAGTVTPTVTWSPGATLSSTNTLTTTASPTTTTTYTLTATANGCTNQDQVTVSIATPPSVTVNNATLCSGQSATLTASPSAPGGSYLWSPGGQTTSAITVSPTTNSTYSVIYTLNGCSSASASGTVTVVPGPTVSVPPVTFCPGSSVTLNATASPSGGAFAWSPGGQTTSSITVNPSSTTNYTVNYTIPGCPATTTTATAALANTLDWANIQAPATASICSGQTVTIYGQVNEAGLTNLAGQAPGITVAYGISTSNTNPATWPASAWSTANYNPSSVGSPNNDEYMATVSGLAAGIYYYAFSYTYNGCTVYGGYSPTGGGFWDGSTNVNGSITVTANVNPSFNAVNAICAGASLSALPLSSTNGITGTWSPTLNNTQTTTYTFTPATGVCATTASLAITVNTLPTAGITNNSNTTQLTCSQTSISLSGTGGGSYSWSNGAAVIGGLATQTITSPGTYILTVTNSSGCTATSNMTITQNIAQPTTSITNTSTILNCNTTSATLIASGGGSYSWSNGTSVVGTNAVLTVSTPGTYTVTVTSPNGCSTSASQVITQDTATPTLQITNAPNTTVLNCSNSTIDLTGSGGSTYSWSYNSNIVGTSAVLSVTLPGTYTLTATGLNGCTTTSSVTITEDITLPLVNINSSNGYTLTCLIPTLTLTATGGVSYQWESNGNVLGNVAALVVNNPGIYNVTATAANGCSNTASFTVLANNAAPSATITSSVPGNQLTCNATSMQLTASGSGSYTWTQGGANLGTSTSIPITAPGTYNLLVTAANGCTATASLTITQNNQAPSVSIAATASGVLTCTNTSITLTGTSSTGTGTATWLNGSTVLSTGPISGVGNVANYVVNTPGTYTLNVLEANGCLGSSTYTVTQNTTVPVAAITNNANTTVLTCTQTSISLLATGGSTYSWSNGANIVGSNASFSPSLPGTYTVTATAANGCIDTEQITLTQNTTAPTVTVTNNTSATQLTCALTSISLTATGGGNYSWSNGAAVVGTTANLTVTTPGTYTVTVTTIANGCSSSNATVITQNITPPSAAITSVPTPAVLTCITTSINLTATGGGTYSWVSGTTNLGTQANISVTTAGTYTVTVTGTNGCTATANTVVTQNIAAPTVNITNAPNTTVLNCTNTTINLTASGGASYSWSNGSAVVGTSASLAVSTPGTYTVTVTGANGCTATGSSTITQNITTPVAGIFNASNTTILTCSQTSISINANGGATYSWSNGTVNIGNAAALSITAPGTYTVTATSANGCTDTEVITITQNITAPIAAIANNGTTTVLDCNTSSISLTASGGVSYSWSNGTSVVGTAALLQVSTAGTYTVTVTAANGCTDTEVITITSQANTNPTFTQIAPICAGTTINLPTTSNNGVAGSWSPAPNLNATTAYTFTPNTGICANTATMTIVVNQYPVITAQNNTICNGSTGTITTQVNLAGGTYTWINSTNTLSTLSSAPNTTSSYTVIYNLAGCTDTATAQIVVNPVPVVQIQNATICAGQSGALIASTNLANGAFLWANGSTNDTLTLSPNNTISESVTYTLNGCTSVPVTATLTVNPVPTITMNNQTICAGDPVTMVANATPAGTYYWGPNAIQGIASNTFTPTQDSIIEVFNVLNGCSSDTIQATVTVLPLPVSTFNANVLQGCVPLSVNFSADVLNNTSYNWQTSNQLNASGAQTTFDFSINGTFSISLTATLNGCSTTTTIPNMIAVDNYPIAAFEPSSQVFSEPNQSLSFWNSSVGAATYTWDFGDGGSSNEEGPTHLFSLDNEGTTVVLYAYSPLGCVDTASFFIGFDPGLVYYIPNSFTPDGDQFNQTFMPIFTSGIDPYNYQLLIYNRWGEVIFESLNPEKGWDGTFGQQGNPCQNGTYTYLITVKIPTVDERKTITGHVNLIR